MDKSNSIIKKHQKPKDLTSLFFKNVDKYKGSTKSTADTYLT